MNRAPDLSLIVSNYNYGEYLYDTIASALGQTVCPDEIIIVDDCSQDHSRQVIARIARENPFVQTIFNPRNIGCNASINAALKLARGKYVCSVGADDPLSNRTFFEKALKLCQAHPAAGFCFGEHSVLYHFPGASFPSPNTVNLAGAARYFSPAEMADEYRRRPSLAIPTSPSLWERTAFLGIGGLREELKWAADWFAAMVLTARSGNCYLPGIYQNIRFSPRSFSQASLTEQKAYRNLLVTIFETLETPEFADAQQFFAIPAVLARFGFKLLSTLAQDVRFAKYLSLDLIRCAVMAENCPFTADLSIFGASPSPDVVSAVCQQVLTGYAGMLTQHAVELQQKGQLSSALGFCRKALDAMPAHAEGLALLAILEPAAAPRSHPGDRAPNPAGFRQTTVPA